ncbi:S9 family peptidase [Hydrotalea sandarakina]|jgi:dipeptidyl-peptidase-4|uniref:Dipeptidyl-peptidase-4 n=1 Tax=Hydrotalea sandarakina TaxID=1004304 RepID=A0A2W7S4E7_9BACT|nr:S9 family peptidase [Hydrotalea sandarakina]PZX65710.1 dipeptidyl-peptidase-4 [Hydrotalea sandarakina]
MRKIFGLLAVACCMAAYLPAQQKTIPIHELVTGKPPKGFMQPLPSVMEWLNNNELVLAQRGENRSDVKLLRYNIALNTTTPFTQNKEAQLGKRVTVMNNDLFLFINGNPTQITHDTAQERNPTFSPDSNFIAYTKNNNLYAYNIANQKEVQLTFDGSATILNGYASWVYLEEIYGRPTHYRAFWWSPDSKTIAYARFDESMVPIFPIYSSQGKHGYLEETRYPQPGDKNPEVKIGFVHPNGGNTTWANFNEKYDQYFGWPVWRSDNNSLWLPWMNRKQDSLIIYEVNTQTGTRKPVYTETQKTWIDLEDRVGGRINFLKNGKGYIAQSDKSGWNMLYLYNMDGTLQHPITNGKYTVTGIEYIDEANRIIYFTARGIENSTRIDLYKISFDGGTPKRLTFGNYTHSINFSPFGNYFITTYSNTQTPARMALVDVNGKIVKELGNAKGAEMDQYAIAKTEIIRIKSADGLFELPALVTWPTHYDKNKKYPMLISIYGGPNAGTVWDKWNWTANRELLAQEGLIQVAFDHRASGQFGKAGVNYMYHDLGYWEMEDYSTMAKWFINNAGADPARICITGFSYGGYMTCLALTYKSDVFTYGMAGGSVVDWQLYDSHYTERYMGTPADNEEGYKKSSVLNYVNNYKGMLQIVHGTMDDNVHMQNSIQLISALEDAKKPFEMMLYPGGRHGWPYLPAKWDDFQNLKTKFIYKYLLRKSVPEGLIH